ncbi:Putative Zinc finger, RING-type [Colletotrichum destructivum]|uniref:Zinc finger, RING-type n=1 Tax=Colletotrichum destructivum TaxID=34406 RepID=A0AAX4I010_9PEZI|nr:Putative Zinc finger, RING-type [Colletotrichum destructivum]
MAPKKNTRPVASCHGMKTRAASRREMESSSSGSSPSSSPEPVPKRVGRGSKRKMSESEESEDSTDDERPAKKTKVTKKPGPAAIGISEESEDDSEEDSEDIPGDYSESEPEDDSGDEEESESGEDKTLVPVGSASPVRPSRETPEPSLHVRSDGFWPAIRDDYMRALQDKSIKIDIPCIICGDDTIVVGQLHWDNYPSHRNDDKKEVPVILWCGHIIGDECLARWKKIRSEAGEPHNCPVCRQSLECSTCEAPLVGWGLSPDCVVMNKATLHDNPDQTRECNWCRAEIFLGEDVRHGGYHLAEPRNRDTARRLWQWFNIVRNRTEREVRTGKHMNVDPALVPGLIMNEVFAEMKQALAALEVDVRDDLDQRLEEVEGMFNITAPWTHVDYSQWDEEDEEEEVRGEQRNEDEDERHRWGGQEVYPPGLEPTILWI